MDVIRNTLKPEYDTWDDPGDYPSGAGAGPLPSYRYIAGASGELVLQLAPEDCVCLNLHWPQKELCDSVSEIINDKPGDITHDISGLKVTKWSVDKVTEDGKVTLTVEECDGDQVGYEDCDDYDPDDWEPY